MFKALWATRNFSKKRFSLRLRYISNNSVRYNKRESARSPNPLASVWRIALSLKNSYVKMISYPRIIRIQCIMCILLKAYDRDKKKEKERCETEAERKSATETKKNMCTFNKRNDSKVFILPMRANARFTSVGMFKCFHFYCWLLFLAYAYTCCFTHHIR